MNPTINTNTSFTQIQNITSLRGIAALYVAIFHLNEIVIQFVSPSKTMLLRHGFLAVDLFFIISGFVICYAYFPAFVEKFSRIKYYKFLKSRLARIYPLHFITLLICLLGNIFFKMGLPSDNIRSFISNILLTQSLGVDDLFSWNVPSWSISAEWWCYVLFPVITFLILKFKGWYPFVGLVCSLLLYLAIMWWLPRTNPFDPTAMRPSDLDVTYDYGFLRGLAGFLLGTIIYKIHTHNLVFKLFSKPIALYIILFTTMIALHFDINNLLIILCWFCLVLATICSDIAHSTRIFKRPFLIYLGEISYSMYMMHSFVLFIIMIPLCAYFGYSGGPMRTPEINFYLGLIFCLVYAVVVILSSKLTYKYFEIKLRTYINNL